MKNFKQKIRYLNFLQGFANYYNTDLPYTDEDVDALAQGLGVNFPACYRELLLLTGFHYMGPEAYYNKENKLENYHQESLKWITKRDGLDFMNDPKIFVFDNSNWKYWYLRTDEGEDPPVYQYVSYSKQQPIQIAEKLSDFVSSRLWCRKYMEELQSPKERVMKIDDGKAIVYRNLSYCFFLKDCISGRHQTTDATVDALEDTWGFKFPEAYRELYLTVSPYNGVDALSESDYSLDEFLEMQENARELAETANLVFDNSMVAILYNHSDTQFRFIRLDEGDNPPVYICYAGEHHYRKIADSISLYCLSPELLYGRYLKDFYKQP